MFTQKHLQHHAVDRVIRTVKGYDPDFRGFLPIAVDAAFALLVPGGIPGEIVMYNGVKAFLEIDPFAKTVGADKDALFLT